MYKYGTYKTSEFVVVWLLIEMSGERVTQVIVPLCFLCPYRKMMHYIPTKLTNHKFVFRRVNRIGMNFSDVTCRSSLSTCLSLCVCVCVYIYIYSGPGSSVGIATDYELDGPGLNPGGGEIFRPSRPALEPTQPPVPGLSRG